MAGVSSRESNLSIGAVIVMEFDGNEKKSVCFV